MPNRPEVVRGSTRRIRTGCGNLYATLNLDEEGNPYEMFTRVGKAGGCAASQLEAMGRLITLLLRAKTPIEVLIKQLQGISCHQPSFQGETKILSCADAVAKALSLHSRREAKLTEQSLEERKEVKSDAVEPVDKIKAIADNLRKDKEALARGACPDCGSPVFFQEGCKKCLCGWSEC
jgi:ribonucleoside-diphosphate reductase alpha chain